MEPTDVEHCVVTTPSVLVAFTRPHTHPKPVERAPYLYGTLNYPHKDLKFIRRCDSSVRTMADSSFAHTDPRRLSSVLQSPRQPQRDESADTTNNTVASKSYWPKRPHTEPQLHDLVTEVK